MITRPFFALSMLFVQVVDLFVDLSMNVKEKLAQKVQKSHQNQRF